MQILILINDKQQGPYTLEQVTGYLATGQLQHTDLAWREGMAEWLPLSQFPEFAARGQRAPTRAGVPGYGTRQQKPAASGGKWGLILALVVVCIAGAGGFYYWKKHSTASSAPAVQDYAIKLEQPLKVGQRYKLTVVANVSSENTMTAERLAPKTQKEDQSFELESVATVLEVDNKGRPTKESHLVEKFLQGANKQPMLPSGAKVIASRSGRRQVFEVDGRPVVGGVAKALEMAVEVTSGGPTDDEVFGTTDRKKVGDCWPVNAALALKDANEELGPAGFSVSNIEGTTTLQSVTNEGGAEVLHLAANLAATMSPGTKGPFTISKAVVNTVLTGAFPQDITKSFREDGMSVVMEMTLSGKPDPRGPTMQISVKEARSITRRSKVLD